jgi:4'-phosphopantetheinyl transferase
VDLAPATVHVWRASLEAGGDEESAFRRSLSAEERARADRFAFDEPRKRWVVSRGRLRVLLGSLTGAEPRDVVLVEDERGKPRLGGTCGQGRLRFNVSHSGDLWVCAVALHREVGVDIERHDRNRHHERLARGYFSAAEREALLALPRAKIPEAFLRCWTRKEAFLKAVGFGITVPLDSFDVTLAPEDPPMVVSTRFDADAAARWSLVDLDPGPGYAGALCVEGPVPEVLLWDPSAAPD